jgi:DnaJ-class molecular chaperone
VADFKEIDEARKLLGLRERATAKEIKQAYRRMAFRYHPDSKAKGDEGDDTMKKLNWAYKLLLDYVASYSYSFTEEDVAKTYPREAYLRRFRDGWFDGI